MTISRTQALPRSESAPRPATRKLDPEVQRLDTLQHPLAARNVRNPGTVMIARNDVNEWTRRDCAPDSLLQHVEMRPAKGLLNLVASARFATGDWSQTRKRDLQRAVAAVLLAYNEVAAARGKPPITIHENHLQGDGKVHEDRSIPRQPSACDYDYYHTLGVAHADNGRMLPHYHLEFGEPLNRRNAGAVLENLHKLSAPLGRELFSRDDLQALLQQLPGAATGPRSRQVALARLRLPQELASPPDRAQRRDELEGAFIALSSQNTEQASRRLVLRNMHMNSFRPAEPLLECFASGHTSVMDDLAHIEAYPGPGAGEALGTGELLAMHHALHRAAQQAPGFEGGTPAQRQALAERLQLGAEKVNALLRSA